MGGPCRTKTATTAVTVASVTTATAATATAGRGAHGSSGTDGGRGHEAVTRRGRRAGGRSLRHATACRRALAATCCQPEVSLEERKRVWQRTALVARTLSRASPSQNLSPCGSRCWRRRMADGLGLLSPGGRPRLRLAHPELGPKPLAARQGPSCGSSRTTPGRGQPSKFALMS